MEIVERVQSRGRHAHAPQKTRVITDDFGNAVAYIRRCSGCIRWLPLRGEFYAPSSGQEDGRGFQRRCKDCSRFYHRKIYRENREIINRRAQANRRRRLERDPSARERERLQEERNRKRRQRDNPEWEREKSRIRSRRWMAKRTPEEIAERNRRHREYMKNNREYMREAQRKYIAKLKKDPKRYAEYLENRRMTHRLRMERQGRELQEMRLGKVMEEPTFDRLPVEPLVPFIRDLIEREQRNSAGDEMDVQQGIKAAVCAALGINVRTLYAWQHGERSMANFDTCDRILIALGRLWWEVWPPEQYPEMVSIWEGD